MSFHGDVHIPASLRKIGGPPVIGEFTQRISGSESQIAYRVRPRGGNRMMAHYTGVVLPSGSYSGVEARAHEDTRDRQVAATTRFRIELTAEQLADMGATLQPNQSSEEIDVTEFVRQGQLTIR